MNANGIAKELLEMAGYTYEYPGYWPSSDGETTIADGLGCNNIMWEVQVNSPLGKGTVMSAGPFKSVSEALDWVAKLNPAL